MMTKRLEQFASVTHCLNTFVVDVRTSYVVIDETDAKFARVGTYLL
jgi:hypothetical protein